MTETTRVCVVCHKTKNLSAFQRPYRAKARTGQIMTSRTCTPCQKRKDAELSKRVYTNRSEESKAKQLVYRYSRVGISKEIKRLEARLAALGERDYFVTLEEWMDILESSENRCFYCGKNGHEVALGPDHFISISKGGRSDPSNCVPCCHSCNCRKRTSTAEEAIARINS